MQLDTNTKLSLIAGTGLLAIICFCISAINFQTNKELLTIFIPFVIGVGFVYFLYRLIKTL